MTTVIVKRGEEKPALVFGPESHDRAMMRVESQCYLHGLDWSKSVKFDRQKEEFVVDASSWYERR